MTIPGTVDCRLVSVCHADMSSGKRHRSPFDFELVPSLLGASIMVRRRDWEAKMSRSNLDERSVIFTPELSTQIWFGSKK